MPLLTHILKEKGYGLAREGRMGFEVGWTAVTPFYFYFIGVRKRVLLKPCLDLPSAPSFDPRSLIFFLVFCANIPHQINGTSSRRCSGRRVLRAGERSLRSAHRWSRESPPIRQRRCLWGAGPHVLLPTRRYHPCRHSFGPVHPGPAHVPVCSSICPSIDACNV